MADKNIGTGFMTALVLASILNPMNTSSLATALPSIARDLNADAAAIGLLVAVVYVASAVAQPVMGNLTTHISPRQILLTGLVIVAAAGIIGALATTTAGVLASRVLIGIGTSAALPSTMVILRHRAEGAGNGAPTRELATLSAAGNVMAAAGLPLGGLLVSTFGWHSVLTVNTPVSLLAIVLVLVYVPASPPRIGKKPDTHLDGIGIILFAAVIVLTAILLNDISHIDWILVGATFLACGCFIGWEWHLNPRSDRHPFIDVHLIIHSRSLLGIYIRSFCISSAVYVSLYSISQWLDVIHHLDASLVGLFMLPQSLLAAASASWAGRRKAVRYMVMASALLLTMGGTALTIASLITTTALIFAIITTVLIGLAFGFGTVGNQSALYLATTSESFGTATGLLRTASYIGGFVATALMSLAYGQGVTDRGLFVIAGFIALAGCFTLILSGPKRLPATVEG